MPTVFDALADDRRREVLAVLADGELPAGAVAERFDLTRQAVSHHLQQLRAAGLVNERREGARRLYSVRPEGLAEVLAFVDRFWYSRLGRLRRAVEGELKMTPS